MDKKILVWFYCEFFFFFSFVSPHRHTAHFEIMTHFFRHCQLWRRCHNAASKQERRERDQYLMPVCWRLRLRLLLNNLYLKCNSNQQNLSRISKSRGSNTSNATMGFSDVDLLLWIGFFRNFVATICYWGVRISFVCSVFLQTRSLNRPSP